MATERTIIFRTRKRQKFLGRITRKEGLRNLTLTGGGEAREIEEAGKLLTINESMANLGATVLAKEEKLLRATRDRKVGTRRIIATPS